MRSSKRIAVRLGLASLAITCLAVQGLGHAAGPNLAPNPGFEASPTDPTGDTTRQPLLPTGWIFEGAAGLFDHSQQNPENPPHSGRRMAAISIPASTSRRLCQMDTCADSPLNLVKDNTAKYYSITPYWRTLNAIPVSAGASYVFSMWSSQTLATVNVGGAITKVRWLDANGVPISETAGPSHIQKPGDAVATGWAQMSATLKAPAGAKGAILMLGAADDLFITQVKYDDVSFAAA